MRVVKELALNSRICKAWTWVPRHQSLAILLPAGLSIYQSSDSSTILALNQDSPPRRHDSKSTVLSGEGILIPPSSSFPSCLFRFSTMQVSVTNFFFPTEILNNKKVEWTHHWRHRNLARNTAKQLATASAICLLDYDQIPVATTKRIFGLSSLLKCFFVSDALEIYFLSGSPVKILVCKYLGLFWRVQWSRREPS